MACGQARKRDGHSSWTPVARRLQQPTRTADLDIDLKHRRSPAKASCRPYSVLLPVGFALPPALPPSRCALTAPFHPCRSNTLRAAAVCSLWHFPWARARRTLSGTACPWSPDFPPRQIPSLGREEPERPSDRLTETGMGAHRRRVKRRGGRSRARGRRSSARARDAQANPSAWRASIHRRYRPPARDGSGAEMPSPRHGWWNRSYR
jgi:hypothetical protein